MDDEFINTFKIYKDLEKIAEMETKEQAPAKKKKAMPEIPVISKPKKETKTEPVITFKNK